MREYIATNPLLTHALTSGIVALIIFFVHKLRTRLKSFPLPPSPRGDPIIGHLRFMPTRYEEEVYKAWGDEVGSDIISLKVPGQVIIVLNSAYHTNELFNKRSSIYSDRPQIHMIASPKLTGWGKGAAVSRYGEHWKAQRKYMHDALGNKTAAMFWPIIEQGARFTARRFLDNPSSEDIFSEMYRMTGSNILSAVYGYSTTSAEDPILKLVQVGLSGFIKAAVPTNFLVNYFPFLEVIPSWFPGAGWKRLAETWRQDKENMINVPYEWAKQHMASGTAPPSIVNTLLTNLRSKSSESPELAAQMEEQEDPLKWAVGSLFGAGSETSASSILVALLAMINYPNVQAKAKQELDNLLGGERLPVLRDRDSLPYMRNIVKEALRWRSVLPGGVPHSCTQEDTYLGYRIPKGSIIIGNIWAMSNDPQVYPEPSRFNPDRFLDPTVPEAPAFGFGRRICPGIQFAEASIFMAISTLLTVFDVNPGRDKDGNPVTPDTRMGPDSLVRYPLNFACTLTPRSEEHKKLLLQG